MARRRKKAGGGGGEGGGWIVTFSDLMTLLLTFFVLLLSMASMDATKLSQIGFTESGTTIPPLLEERFFVFGANVQVPERNRLIDEILRHPPTPKFLEENQDEIRDLFFPDEALPPELLRGTLNENLYILDHPEGVVLVMTEELLFEQDAYVVASQGEELLEILVPIIQSVDSDVNISGYTDNVTSRGMPNDHLSVLRAMGVMEYFLRKGVRPQRFSVSGYGADWPMFDNETDKGRAKNRRVEILLKTKKLQSE